jgi:hypothetical protein
VKNLLLTGLTLLSLALATASSTTAESLEPIKSSGNLRSTLFDFKKKLNSAPITPAPDKDNTSTQIDCPQPIPGESARSCSGSWGWGTTPEARERARERAKRANEW